MRTEQKQFLWRGVAVAILLIGSMAAAGCGGSDSTAPSQPVRTLISTPAAQRVSMPNVVGLAPVEAIRRVCSAGIRVGAIIGQRHYVRIGPNQHPRSHVVATEPAAAGRVIPGSKVKLVVWPKKATTAYDYACAAP